MTRMKPLNEPVMGGVMAEREEPSASQEREDAQEKRIPGIYNIRLKKGPQLRKKQTGSIRPSESSPETTEDDY